MKNKCPKCNFEHYDWERCLTSFYTNHEYFSDNEDDWKETPGYSFEDAAERIAIKLNEDDPIVNDNVCEKVAIANIDRSEIHYFDVYAEPEICYYVKEVDNVGNSI
jgi:hypothetical protein